MLVTFREVIISVQSFNIHCQSKCTITDYLAVRRDIARSCKNCKMNYTTNIYPFNCHTAIIDALLNNVSIFDILPACKWLPPFAADV